MDTSDSGTTATDNNNKFNDRGGETLYQKERT